MRSIFEYIRRHLKEAVANGMLRLTGKVEPI